MTHRDGPDMDPPEVAEGEAQSSASGKPDSVTPCGGRKPIPVGTQWTPKGGADPCTDCHGPIAYLELQASGMWRRHEADGMPHAARCPARARKPRKNVCPHCSSERYETIYTDIPLPHFARGDCLDCGRSWWIGKQVAT
jgi:hypothetical protein